MHKMFYWSHPGLHIAYLIFMELSQNGTAPPADGALAPVYLVESLLFVAAEPVPLGELARALQLSVADTDALLHTLTEDYQARGLRIQRHNDAVQLVTAPEAAATIHQFLGMQSATPRLSSAALETLAIVAYKQPLTKAGLEAIRGVDCSGPVRTLLQRNLIAEVGRQHTAGRPVLYGTTHEFLRQFGVASLAHLPPLEEDDGKRVVQK